MTLFIYLSLYFLSFYLLSCLIPHSFIFLLSCHFFRNYLSLFIYFNSIILFKCFIFICICICICIFILLQSLLLWWPTQLFYSFFFSFAWEFLKKTLGEAMVCGLEKHCGDLTTTSLPIIATVQCHRRQPPRQCTMSRSGPRFSRMWKQVLGLYRGFLWATHPKFPKDRRWIESFVFNWISPQF